MAPPPTFTIIETELYDRFFVSVFPCRLPDRFHHFHRLTHSIRTGQNDIQVSSRRRVRGPKGAGTVYSKGSKVPLFIIEQLHFNQRGYLILGHIGFKASSDRFHHRSVIF